MPTVGTSEWEASIITRLQASDETALRELMQAYFDNVADVAFRYVRTVDGARDVAQDVFIRLWERRLSLVPSGHIIHYLRRAARNAALDALDRDASANRLAESLQYESDLIRPQAENLGISAVEADELHQAVRDAMRALTPRVREVALLYLEQGLEPGEIAQLLGVAPRTVYNQLRTAMRTVGETMSGWRPGSHS
ncbi:MAG TPA: sigma-70 family RNA polymerase sigma factor [Gemmatimonadaceae bacterium]|jgi:RNA polymerase sigma-70 factor (ECF subfamily)|nr:sigma-70 family RNA polymerase sigma factor [Gemmatimonadaceae bacterium]